MPKKVKKKKTWGGYNEYTYLDKDGKFVKRENLHVRKKLD